MPDLYDNLPMPGDPDCDFDLHDVRVDTVTRLYREFVFSTVGGQGRWADPATGQVIDDIPVTRMTFSFLFTDAVPGQYVESVHELLICWRDAQVLLRYLSAPGRLDAFVEMQEPDIVLRLPRFCSMR